MIGAADEHGDRVIAISRDDAGRLKADAVLVLILRTLNCFEDADPGVVGGESLALGRQALQLFVNRLEILGGVLQCRRARSAAAS
jgi:hypothetical protein